SPDGGRGRFRRDGLPRARSDAVHGRTSPGWRNRSPRRATDRGTRGLESRRRWPVVAATARSRAAAIDLAQRARHGRWAYAGLDPWWRDRTAGRGTGGLSDRIQRWFAGHATDAQRRRARLHVCLPLARRPSDCLDAIFAAGGAERGVFDVPDAGR